jgi:hypothetical protein
MIDADELARRFDFHSAYIRDDDGTLRPDRGLQDRHTDVRAACARAAADILKVTPEGREQSLAITHLEEAMFWGNAAIAREDA